MKRNGLSTLSSDHDRIRDLLDRLAGTTESALGARRSLLDRVDRELRIHARVESEVFFRVYRQTIATPDAQEECHEDRATHRAVQNLLAELRKTAVGSRELGVQLEVLRELVTQHFLEEEERAFALLRERLTSAQLDELGARIETRRAELTDGIVRRKHLGASAEPIDRLPAD